jgi:anti-sigma factor RsiW
MTTSFDNDHPWEDRLSEYLDGALTDDEARSLDEHLGGCESCRAALAGLRAVVEQLHGDHVDPVPPDAWSRIARRLTVQRPVKVPKVPGGRERASYPIAARTLRIIATAASLVLTLAGGMWIGALLCMARPQWSPPAWMHLRSRASMSTPSRIPPSVIQAPNASDSTRGAAALLRRALVALDRELGEAERTLENQPATAGRERVERLKRTRLRLQAALDSLTSTPSRQPR